MRHILWLLLFITITGTVSAQSSFQNDTVIAAIGKNIPKGWVVKVQDSCLFIIRVKPIYRTLANHMNGPAELGHKKVTTDADTPPEGSVKDTLELVFKMTPMWNMEKYREIKRNNDHYYIASDRVHFAHKKGGATFIPVGKDSSVTVKGDPAIDRYNDSLYKEESRLDNSLISVPENCTQFFFLEYVWLKKDNAPYPMSYDIFPEQANIEIQKIRDYIYGTCTCYRQYESH
jgi:hypothetical protein